MAKTNAPLFSFGAQGSLAGTVSYQKSPSGSRATRLPDHPDADSPAQQTNRTAYLAACAYYNALHEHEKEFYNYLASQVGVTGFNYCIASHMLGFVP